MPAREPAPHQQEHRSTTDLLASVLLAAAICAGLTLWLTFSVPGPDRAMVAGTAGALSAAVCVAMAFAARRVIAPDHQQAGILALAACIGLQRDRIEAGDLAQAPVLTLVYALFASPQIAGAPNVLLDGSLFGAPLGRHLADLVAGVAASEGRIAALAARDPTTLPWAERVSLPRHALGALDVVTDLRIDYLKPAETRRDVIARAECYKVTRNVAFVRAMAFHDEADPIAAAAGWFSAVGSEGAAAHALPSNTETFATLSRFASKPPAHWGVSARQGC